MKELINELWTLNPSQIQLVSEYINELKNPKKKRSKSQNSYCWELIVKIANKVGLSKKDTYFNYLKEYGQSEIVSMLSSISPDGYFKYYETIGISKLNGKIFTHYKIFKGSSQYNTLEMKILLDGIIQDAESLGIPTLTDEEIKKMRLI